MNGLRLVAMGIDTVVDKRGIPRMTARTGVSVATPPIIERLLASSEPAVVYKTRHLLLDEPETTPAMLALRQQIRSSPLARRLLSHCPSDGKILTAPERNQTHAYQKWQGPHWTLYSLAEIDYPPGDSFLLPMRGQFYDWLFTPKHLKPPRTTVIQGQEDRVRRCAGQEGYAVWYSLILGLSDGRTEELVGRLKQWQWPDGGWNCDKRPEARISSFYETLIPMRALALHARLTGDASSAATAAKAAEVFLSRRIFLRRKDRTVIRPDFVRTHFPFFYSYDILYALLVMAEAGFLGDERCREALDLLKSKQLPDGGFPLEEKTWKYTDSYKTRGTFADWGAAGKTGMHGFVTVYALYVLKKAGWAL